MEDTQQPMTRGKAFTWDQDVAICNARLKISKDPFNVVLKPNLNFSDCVFQEYIELTGDQNVRSKCGIESRWKIIFRSCNKFHDCLKQVEEKQKGLTESDKVLEAKMLYFQLEKKYFAFTHCWVLLQHTVKWKSLTTAKRSNPHTMASKPNIDSSPKSSDPPTISTKSNMGSSPKRSDPPTVATKQNIDISPKSDPHTMATDPNIHYSFSSQPQESNTIMSFETDEDRYYTTEVHKSKRPTRRAEKEARKRSKLVNTLDSRFCDLIQQFSKQLSETGEQKAKIAERKVKVLEEMNEREQREHDDRIMSMNTSNMEPLARAYYEQRKNDVYFKAMARTKDTSNMNSQTGAHHNHNDIYGKMLPHNS